MNDARMTSLELAELTGLGHAALLEEIEDLLRRGALAPDEAAAAPGPDGSVLRLLDFTGAMTLVAGLRADLRAAVVRRWRALERGEAEPLDDPAAALAGCLERGDGSEERGVVPCHSEERSDEDFPAQRESSPADGGRSFGLRPQDDRKDAGAEEAEAGVPLTPDPSPHCVGRGEKEGSRRRGSIFERRRRGTETKPAGAGSLGWHTAKEIAALWGLHLRTTSRDLNRLAEAGKIEVTRQANPCEARRWRFPKGLPAERPVEEPGPPLPKDAEKAAAEFRAMLRMAQDAGLKGEAAVKSADAAMRRLRGFSPLALLGLEQEEAK